MKTPSRCAPTRRELILLAGLVFTLLFFIPNNFASDASPHLANADVGTQQPFEKGLVTTGSYPDPRLTWASSVPETEILHYSPGQYPINATGGTTHFLCLCRRDSI